MMPFKHELSRRIKLKLFEIGLCMQTGAHKLTFVFIDWFAFGKHHEPDRKF